MLTSVLLNLKDFLDGINRYSPAIQTGILLVAAIYAYVQTRGLIKQNRLTLITSTSLHLKDVNTLLVQNGQLSKEVLGEDDKQALASIVLGTFELWHELHQRKLKLLSNDEWESDERVIAQTMQSPYMESHWSANSLEYRKNFRDYLDDPKRGLFARIKKGEFPRIAQEKADGIRETAEA